LARGAQSGGANTLKRLRQERLQVLHRLHPGLQLAHQEVERRSDRGA